MKKFIAGMLALTLVLSLAGCGGSSKTEESVPAENTAAEPAAEESEAEEPAPEETAPEEAEAPAEEPAEALEGFDISTEAAVIYDEGGITVTAGPYGYDDFTDDWGVPFSITNNTDAAIGIDYTCVEFNGFEKAKNSVMAPVEAGETYETTRTFDYIVEMTGCESLVSYEFDAVISDYDSGDVIADLGHVVLRGDAYGEELPDPVTDEALLLYSDGGVQMYVCPALHDNQEWSYVRIDLFCTNASDENIYCEITDLTANGTTTYAMRQTDHCLAGCRSVNPLADTAGYDDLGVAAADEIQTLEFDFEVYDHNGTTISYDHVVLANDGGTLSVVSITPIETEEAAG